MKGEISVAMGAPHRGGFVFGTVDSPVTVMADLFGLWAVHRTPDKDTWSVTHRPTGKAIEFFPYKAQAVRAAKALKAQAGWDSPEAVLLSDKFRRLRDEALKKARSAR